MVPHWSPREEKGKKESSRHPPCRISLPAQGYRPKCSSVEERAHSTGIRMSSLVLSVLSLYESPNNHSSMTHPFFALDFLPPPDTQFQQQEAAETSSGSHSQARIQPKQHEFTTAPIEKNGGSTRVPLQDRTKTSKKTTTPTRIQKVSTASTKVNPQDKENTPNTRGDLSKAAATPAPACRATSKGEASQHSKAKHVIPLPGVPPVRKRF